MKSLKVRVFPSRQQAIVIQTLSNEHRLLYNHLLEFAKKGENFKQLNQRYKNFIHDNQLTILSHPAQTTSRTLFNSIKSFYALKKKDSTAQFPYKFKSYKDFFTFQFHWNNGCGGFKLFEQSAQITLRDGHKLNINLPDYFRKCGVTNATIKTMIVKEEEGKHFLIFVYSEKPTNVDLDKEKFLSIDLGISSIATCFSNATKPFSIQNNRFKKIERQKEHVQSLRDKKKKGSNRWKKLTSIHKKLTRENSNKNKDFQHKVSKAIIDTCLKEKVGTLVVGDIRTKKLSKGKRSTKGLNKSTQNQGTLSRFKTFLNYKSRNAGIDFHLVNESYTSQINCLTGIKTLSSELSIREVELEPGLIVDRDLNSATNIAKRHMGRWFAQTENFVNFLQGFQKMYVNNSSELKYV
jgi:IS605 OrfB family transposase